MVSNSRCGKEGSKPSKVPKDHHGRLISRLPSSLRCEFPSHFKEVGEGETHSETKDTPHLRTRQHAEQGHKAKDRLCLGPFFAIVQALTPGYRREKGERLGLDLKWDG